jgi:hypothetical protein
VSAQGFAIIPRSLLHDKTISQSAKWVYVALSSRVNAALQCWPSHARIADDTNLSVTTVKQALKELRDRRLVTWEQRTDPEHGQTANVYTLGHLVDGADLPDEEPDDDPPPRRNPPTPPAKSAYPPRRNPPTERDPVERDPMNDVGAAEASPNMLDAPSVDDDFAAWYAIYPRHLGRGDALRAYRATRKKKVPAATLLTGAQTMAKTYPPGSDKQFCPYPATWLNQERWADEIEPARSTTPPGRWGEEEWG